MMTGDLYIDEKDAYSVYGIYILEGGYNELVAMPPLKSIETNDWQEEDGIEADLSAPVLNSREVTIRFAVREAYRGYLIFIETLSDGAYHVFDCPYIGRTYRLRLVSVGSFTSIGDFGVVNLKFADDFPLEGYTYSPPVSRLATGEFLSIGGVPLSDYGLRTLQGTFSEITKVADVKPNLYRNIGTRSGAIYDGKRVTCKSKDVKLKCLMRAESLAELWRNYDALLYDLTRPGERVLAVDELQQEFRFYYKSCQVTAFYPEDKIWLQFTLTVTFTRNPRIEI